MKKEDLLLLRKSLTLQKQILEKELKTIIQKIKKIDERLK